jgi:hypothetical protein
MVGLVYKYKNIAVMDHQNRVDTKIYIYAVSNGTDGRYRNEVSDAIGVGIIQGITEIW